MRRRAACALAIVLMCACKADDQVLTPDDESSGRDATVSNDAGMNPIVTGDGGNTLDGAVAPGGDAAPESDATSLSDAAPANDATPANDAATSDVDGGPTKPVAKDPDCDLNGIWIGRQNTESVAFFLSQFANNWYYLEFTQNGEQVTVSKHMDCGIEVQGSALVQLSRDTMRALTTHNKQTGRAGTFAKQADGTCALEMEKFWSVRGVSEEAYAPAPRSRDATIQQLQSEKPLPADGAGAEDWDGDGTPGIAWQISGDLSGVRHSAQRDWTRWFSAPGHTISAAMDFTGDQVVRADFANEEVIYDASSALLTVLSQPNGSALHALTLHFLGRTRDDPRAQAIVKADDVETCLAIQAALPALNGLR